VLLQPPLHILRVPFEPSGLSADSIDALRQRHVKALRALVGEELLDVLDVLTVGEARCGDRDDRAQHAQARRQPALKFRPVLFDPLPQRVAAFLVRPQRCDGEVDVLALDVLAEGKVESALDELGCLCAAEGAKSGVALVGGGSAFEFFDNGVVLGRVSRCIIRIQKQAYLFIAALSQDNGVDAAADVGVDS
jgi:hypothetical protein